MGGSSQVSREIQLHTSLIHDSIIGMYAAWKDSSHVYMVLEWAAGVSEDLEWAGRGE